MASPSAVSRLNQADARRAHKRRCLESDGNRMQSLMDASEPISQPISQPISEPVSEPTGTSTFHLFRKLAPEIRNQIYKEVAKDTTLVLPPCKHRSLAPAMLLVSKQVAAEYRGILFSHAKLVVPVNRYDFSPLIKTLAKMPKQDLEMLRERNHDVPNSMEIRLSLYDQEPCIRHDMHRQSQYQVEQDALSDNSGARETYDASYYGCICLSNCQCHRGVGCNGMLDHGKQCAIHRQEEIDYHQEERAGREAYIKSRGQGRDIDRIHHTPHCCCGQRKQLGLDKGARPGGGEWLRSFSYNHMVRRIIDWKWCDDHLNIAWSYMASTDIRSRVWKYTDAAHGRPIKPEEFIDRELQMLQIISTRCREDLGLANLVAQLELSFQRLSEQNFVDYEAFERYWSLVPFAQSKHPEMSDYMYM